MSDQNESKAVTLQNAKFGWGEINVAILVVCDNPFFIVFLSGDEFFLVLRHIFSFMSINIHPILLLTIPPIQLLQLPLSCFVLKLCGI